MFLHSSFLLFFGARPQETGGSAQTLTLFSFILCQMLIFAIGIRKNVRFTGIYGYVLLVFYLSTANVQSGYKPYTYIKSFIWNGITGICTKRTGVKIGNRYLPCVSQVQVLLKALLPDGDEIRPVFH